MPKDKKKKQLACEHKNLRWLKNDSIKCMDCNLYGVLGFPPKQPTQKEDCEWSVENETNRNGKHMAWCSKHGHEIEIKDLPQPKEEKWEKEVAIILEGWDITFCTSDYNDLIDFIRQLLKETRREVLEEVEEMGTYNPSKRTGSYRI